MFKFFDSWKRKIGLVSLLVACTLTAGWIRSSFRGDFLALVIGTKKLSILSQQGSISTAVYSQGSNGQSAEQKSGSVRGHFDGEGEPRRNGESAEQKSGWWSVKLPKADLKFVHYPRELPYWSIVFPLLLLSMWLLLVKPPEPLAKLPPISEKSTWSNKRQKRRAKRSR